MTLSQTMPFNGTVTAWPINSNLYFINIRRFCSVISIVKRIKSEARDSEKVFVNYDSDKGLFKLNNKKPNNLIIKMGK